VDHDGGNNGGAHRVTDVDIAPASDAGDGYTVGWAGAGEWLNYSVDVAAAGVYALHIRLASMGEGGIFHIEVDGVDATGPIIVPDTGDWQAWDTIHVPIELTAGPQVWRVVMDTNGSSGAVANFNWFRLSQP
jgi:Carbohydrate binding module (family 6)